MKKTSVLAVTLAAMLTLTACNVSTSSSASSDTGSGQGSSTNTSQNSQTSEKADSELIYGTATLTYKEFFSGDVSSTDSFDAVSSATTSKYEIMPNMATDFVDAEKNADGYHITGVKNVNLAVPSGDYEAYMSLNPTFVPTEGEAPAQYKMVTMENGKAVYSETKFNIADTVTDAKAELVTGGTWGDYQINITDGATAHLRNTREDEFDINSQIQGIILETASGLEVGMEHLQSIWVQPYEVSFNVLDDNSHNTHIAAYDNLPELSKLIGENVTKITYIMPDSAYVYEFDGIYIKPIYKGSVTASVSEGYDAVTLSTGSFSDFQNGSLTVTYALGSGRSKDITALLETPLKDGTDTYSLDVSAIAGKETGGVYEAVIFSDSYADIPIPVPMSKEQEAALNAVLTTAKEKLSKESDNAVLAEHIQEAEELLSKEAASSSEAGSLINELAELTSEPDSGEGSKEGAKH